VNRWQYASAFVIQFPSKSDIQAGRFSGRVEHVASGRAARFESQTELLDFMEQIMQKICASYSEPVLEEIYQEESNTNV
jgi:hypothetical protein